MRRHVGYHAASDLILGTPICKAEEGEARVERAASYEWGMLVIKTLPH